MAKLLSYHDVLLRTEDLELLEGPCWLNDQVIAFFFEYLSKEVHAGLQGALLVTGATAFLLLHTQGPEVASIVSSLKIPQQQLVLLAVNDNPYVDHAAGGSHWSLLAYSVHDHTFRHYDSARGSNWLPARQLAQKLQAAHSSSSSSLRFEEPACPQQRNGYDCGIYVLAIAQLLCRRLQEAGEGMSFAVGDTDVTQEGVAVLREEICGIILDKAKQQRGQQ